MSVTTIDVNLRLSQNMQKAIDKAAEKVLGKAKIEIVTLRNQLVAMTADRDELLAKLTEAVELGEKQAAEFDTALAAMTAERDRYKAALEEIKEIAKTNGRLGVRSGYAWIANLTISALVGGDE